MNVQEFAALKKGDKVNNPLLGGGTSTTGEVVEATDRGVRIVWGPRHERETPFFYSVNTTAWMHWVKVDVP